MNEFYCPICELPFWAEIRLQQHINQKHPRQITQKYYKIGGFTVLHQVDHEIGREQLFTVNKP